MIDNEYSLLDPLNRPVPGSFCDIFGCVLEAPSGPERTRVDSVLNAIREDLPFCQQVKDHGRAAVARNLRFFRNPIFPSPGKQLFGNAPFDSRLGGPVIYLYGPKLRDSDIVHEAVHTVPRIDQISWAIRMPPIRTTSLHWVQSTKRLQPAWG